MTTIPLQIAETARALLDLFFPPSCGGCGLPLAGGILCPTCAELLDLIGSPRCPTCSTPFESGRRDHLCSACLVSPPPFETTTAAFVYGGPIADGLRALKYGPSPERIAPLAEVWRQASPPLPEVDLAVPVPLHPRRLHERGFNQAVLLARPLLRASRIPLETGALFRSETGRAQAGLTRRERRQGPRGAFLVPPLRRPRIEGCRILLIDDVMTTTATARACARALRRAHAAEVHVAVLARA